MEGKKRNFVDLFSSTKLCLRSSFLGHFPSLICPCLVTSPRFYSQDMLRRCVRACGSGNNASSLNSHGDIYITKINKKDTISFASYYPEEKKRKPSVNIFQLGLVTRQGQISDGKWPRKLDLRQSLVLENKSTKFLFFPSITKLADLATTHPNAKLTRRYLHYKDKQERYNLVCILLP